MNYLIYRIVNVIINIIIVLIFARFVISWIRLSPYHPTWGKIVQLIYQLTEPMLAPIRRMLPQTGMLDWSPMVLMIGLWLLQKLLVSILF